MPRPHPDELGRAAEDRALAWYLRERPVSRVLARRWRRRGGELDLVLEERGPRGGILVAVEVRACGAGNWLRAAETLTAIKRRRLERALALWLMVYRGDAREIRGDLWGEDRGVIDFRPGAWA